MAYDQQLAQRVRRLLAKAGVKNVTEKPMFSGLAFLVNDKMCVNISGDQLMCRFDPKRRDELADRPGFQVFEMNGRIMKGYCYVAPDAIRDDTDLKAWVDECLAFNPLAKSSKKKANGRTA